MLYRPKRIPVHSRRTRNPQIERGYRAGILLFEATLLARNREREREREGEREGATEHRETILPGSRFLYALCLSL
jgi:hypothetical protein